MLIVFHRLFSFKFRDHFSWSQQTGLLNTDFICQSATKGKKKEIHSKDCYAREDEMVKGEKRVRTEAGENAA